MSNLHRINWIDKQIRSGKHPNCNTIAQEFEISQRQAARDIEYLKYSLGAPLEYSSKLNGYIYSKNNFILPNVFLTEEEKILLSTLAKQYKDIGNTKADEIATLFQKLTSEEEIEKNEESPKLKTAEIKIVQYYSTIEECVQKKIKIDLNYLAQYNVTTQRIVHPYQIIEYNSKYYAHCYCEKREQFRFFNLKNIISLKILDEGFQRKENYSPKVAKETFNNRKKPFIALIKLKEHISFDDAYIFDVFKQSEDEYKLSFYESSKLISFLISKGKAFTILKPDWLKEKLFSKLSLILNINRT